MKSSFLIKETAKFYLLFLKKYMAQSLSGVYIHVIFSTKGRRPLILEKFEKRLYDYLAKLAVEFKCQPFEINGTSDHVHLLLSLHRTLSQSDLCEKLKANSSRWFKNLSPETSDFGWQNGFAMFSVDLSTFDRIRQYICNQKEHHKKLSSKEEYLKFLKWAKINYDEKFLWED